MNKVSCTLLCASLAAISPAVGADGEQLFADLDRCELTSGATIEQCRVGYRTFGERDADDSNVVLFLTWFTGTTEALATGRYIGPEYLVDSDRYFVVAVDALSNGVSSSPSNSRLQAGVDFPAISIADMVDSQHRLLTRELGISRVHAVIGISMGGMQAFEWLVRYPDFMDKAISISGTPVQTAYDLLLWETELETIEALGETEAAYRIIAGLLGLVLRPPEYVVSRTSPADYPDYIARSVEAVKAHSLLDYVPALKAMMGLDIGRSAGGTLEDAAALVRAETLIVVSPTDHVVNPEPSRDFAELTGGRLLELDGACGHLAHICERRRLIRAVRRFLD